MIGAMERMSGRLFISEFVALEVLTTLRTAFRDASRADWNDVVAEFSESCAVCSHGAHTEGEPLSPDCGLCEASLCTADPFCCSTWWDAACVARAATLCPDDCS